MSEKFVYVIGMVSQGFCKVGIAKKPDERVRTIQTSNPYRVSVDAVFGPFRTADAVRVERIAHVIMAEAGACGEWFFVGSNVAKAVVQEAVVISRVKEWASEADAASRAFAEWMMGRAA